MRITFKHILDQGGELSTNRLKNSFPKVQSHNNHFIILKLCTIYPLVMNSLAPVNRIAANLLDHIDVSELLSLHSSNMLANTFFNIYNLLNIRVLKPSLAPLNLNVCTMTHIRIFPSKLIVFIV